VPLLPSALHLTLPCTEPHRVRHLPERRVRRRSWPLDSSHMSIPEARDHHKEMRDDTITGREGALVPVGEGFRSLKSNRD
jgi:hypothetical protein